jgi:hypothetical protein
MLITKVTKMKLFQGIVQENISGMFLYLVILFANIDYKGLLDYCLKALLGGLIWFGYKVIGEYYIIKIRKDQKEKQKQQQQSQQHKKQ